MTTMRRFIGVVLLTLALGLDGTFAQLTSTDNQLWYQDSPGILDVSESDDFFGSSLAVGDFNGDGFDDLAIGVPDELIVNAVGAGAVNVLYGSGMGVGLTSSGNQFWNQNSTGIPGVSEASDYFGMSLAAGDFDGDGFDDLAIGVPDEDVDGGEEAGAVNVLYGSGAGVGLTSSGSQLWHQNSTGILGSSEDLDHFGSSLVAGDFDGDGFDDLAIGVPEEEVDNVDDAGAVNVLYGSGDGLSSAGNQLWHQNSTGMLDEAEDQDFFGYSLASGNFDGDGYDDLAIGVLWEAIGNTDNAGAVSVLFGGNNIGLRSTGSQLWSQDSPGILDASGSFDMFARALSSGDFDADGYDDLAIGADWEDVGNVAAAGAVSVLYGSGSGVGLTSSGNQFWNQNSTGIQGESENDDSFGASLTAGDFDGDGDVDLAIGVPGEALGSITRAGVVNVLYGSWSEGGLTSSGNQLWHQNSTGVLGNAEDLDYLGASVASGDFDGDDYADLAIGVGGESLDALTGAGVVNVLYGSGASSSRKENPELLAGPESALEYALKGNYPNPFNPVTMIAYSIREAGPVKLTVYNTVGQLVATLVNNPSHPAGEFAATFNASDLASGVYLYRLETSGATEVKKMMLVK